MRRGLGIGLAFMATFAMAGCGGGEPEPTETAASTPSASPTPTLTPTPTPTPAPTPEPVVDDPADLATWLIDGNGIGPIDAGVPIASVGALLPGFTATPPNECGVWGFDRGDGLSFALPGETEIGLVVMSAQTPSAITAGPRTAAGIGLGSTGAEVEAAYPGVPAETNDGNRMPHYAVPDAGRYMIILLNESGVVGSVWVTSFGILPWDLC